MRILHYLPSLNPALGGPGRAVIDLCTALADADHAVTLATSDISGQFDASVPLRAMPNLITLPRPRSPGSWHGYSALSQIKSLIQTHELVHVHGMWELANAQFAHLCKSLRKPYVVSPHGMLDAWSMNQSTLKKTIFMAFAGRRYLRGADGIHLTAQSELSGVRRHVSNGSARVVPLLVDLEPYRRINKSAHDEFETAVSRKPRILFLSRLHPKKGLEILLLAARLLVDRGRQFSLIVAGDGEPAYVSTLKSLAAEVGTEVHFLGMVGGSRKLAVYRSCDVFALPTQHENFGLVFIEALAAGLPVVTTQDIALSSELAASGAAFTVGRTPEQFAAALDRLISDLAFASAMGNRGREWAFSTFDLLTSTRRFESFYRELIDIAAINNRASKSSLFFPNTIATAAELDRESRRTD